MAEARFVATLGRLERVEVLEQASESTGFWREMIVALDLEVTLCLAVFVIVARRGTGAWLLGVALVDFTFQSFWLSSETRLGAALSWFVVAIGWTDSVEGTVLMGEGASPYAAVTFAFGELFAWVLSALAFILEGAAEAVVLAHDFDDKIAAVVAGFHPRTCDKFLFCSTSMVRQMVLVGWGW